MSKLTDNPVARVISAVLSEAEALAVYAVRVPRKVLTASAAFVKALVDG